MILPGAASAAALGVLAERLRPPAADVAERCATAAAILLAVKLVAWVARSGHTFGREQRLLTFVSFAAILMSWMGVRQAIADSAFDYLVSTQRAELADSSRTLASQIDAFVQTRRRVAPPAPRPETWEEDEAAFVRFEAQTVIQFERTFGGRVRADYLRLSLRGLGDRDLDRFYRRPANEFQMRVIATRLAFLAGKLDEQNRGWR